MQVQEEVLNSLIPSIKEFRKEHKKFKGWDGALYNGGTVVVLLCTVASTFIPTETAGFFYWLPKILLGIATFWVALDRSKSYGQRWRFHIERENQFGVLEHRINTFRAWPDDKKPERFLEIISDFEKIVSSESNIPGVGKIEGLPTK